MYRSVLAALTITLLAAAPGCAQEDGSKTNEMTNLPGSMIENMFDNMRRTPGLNVDEPLLWGYFFVGQSGAELEHAAAILVADGYSVVDIYHQGEEGAGGHGQWWLYVERGEHHTVASLIERNKQLNAFAVVNGLVSYDGMDVGPVP